MPAPVRSPLPPDERPGAQTSDEQQTRHRSQSAYLGRLMSVPLISLPLLAIWVVVASVLTPLDVDQRETLLALRWALIVFGALLIAVCDAVALVQLWHAPID